MRDSIDGSGGQLEVRSVGDQQLTGGGGDNESIVVGAELVDADQLRELAEVLLALVLKGSSVGMGRGGLPQNPKETPKPQNPKTPILFY